MISVLVADDQHLVRGALVALLELAGDLTVVAQAATGSAAVSAAARHVPDVVLLDIEMPDGDGLWACGQITRHQPGCSVMIVTTFGRPGYLRRAIAAGATGFVVKDTPAASMADLVRRLHGGEIVIDPALALASLRDGISPLTDRECAALHGVLGGQSAREIARQLHLSAGTVRNHLSSAIAKTGATTSPAAARAAQERGWL